VAKNANTGTTDDGKYAIKEVSSDPADFLTGPRGGEANRTHGGTTQDGAMQVLARTSPEDSAEQ
jgi:hypothetical protein